MGDQLGERQVVRLATCEERLGNLGERNASGRRCRMQARVPFSGLSKIGGKVRRFAFKASDTGTQRRHWPGLSGTAAHTS